MAATLSRETAERRGCRYEIHAFVSSNSSAEFKQALETDDRRQCNQRARTSCLPSAQCHPAIDGPTAVPALRAHDDPKPTAGAQATNVEGPEALTAFAGHPRGARGGLVRALDVLRADLRDDLLAADHVELLDLEAGFGFVPGDAHVGALHAGLKRSFGEVDQLSWLEFGAGVVGAEVAAQARLDRLQRLLDRSRRMRLVVVAVGLARQPPHLPDVVVGTVWRVADGDHVRGWIALGESLGIGHVAKCHAVDEQHSGGRAGVVVCERARS